MAPLHASVEQQYGMAPSHSSTTQLFYRAHYTALLHNSSTGPTTQLYYTTLLQGPLHSSSTGPTTQLYYTALLQGPLHSSTTQLFYRAHYTALLRGSTRFAYAYIHTCTGHPPTHPLSFCLWVVMVYSTWHMARDTWLMEILTALFSWPRPGWDGMEVLQSQAIAGTHMHGIPHINCTCPQPHHSKAPLSSIM